MPQRMLFRSQVIVVDDFGWDSTKVSFESGELPDTTVVIFREHDLGAYDSAEEMFHDLWGRYGIPTPSKDPSAWQVFAAEGKARLHARFMATYNNEIHSPSKDELRRWETGEINLWSAYITVSVRVGRLTEPDPRTLAQLTGLPIYTE